MNSYPEAYVREIHNNRSPDYHFVKSYIFSYNKFDDIRSKNSTTCKVDIIQNDGVYLVVFTELNANKGPSITNSMEYLIENIVKREGFDITNAHFMERYENNPNALDEFIYSTDISEGWLESVPKWIRLSDKAAAPILKSINWRKDYSSPEAALIYND